LPTTSSTGFWQYNNTVAHHLASKPITFNISGLNSTEQFLALSALQAWSEVANISFVQTSGSANITFTHNGTMQAYTSGSWPGGLISSQTIDISTDWVTTDGGANDGKTGIDSYGLPDLHPRNRARARAGPSGAVQWQRVVFDQRGLRQRHLAIFHHVVFLGGELFREFVPLRGHAADGGHLRRGFDVRRGDLDATSDTVYGFNSNAGAVFSFAQLHLGAGADHL
jgi:hypothetical protein